ncbi:hypothetical protein [Aporhodopirellula aestuarii]|nr:hypothetical protein [Aporhodopirellula aestuarii]
MPLLKHSDAIRCLAAPLFAILGTACLATSPGVNLNAAEQTDIEPTGKQISLSRSIEPSFHIEPVVHRFRGRRGEVIPFSFEIKSNGQFRNVTVRAVSLRQDETGVIQHDDKITPSPSVRFTSPKRFQLQPGEQTQIEGEVTVPFHKTNYVSFGILVHDNDPISDTPNASHAEAKTRASNHLVTQYVLRVDIETGAQVMADMNQLHFDHGELVAKNGVPYIHAFLTNPTDNTLECEVQAQLSADDSTTTRPIRLNMPSRSELDDDSRYLVRIMPHSRLRLEGMVDGSLPVGDYSLNVQLSDRHRSVVQATFPTRVDSNGFRGLSVPIPTNSDDVLIEPAQMELGRVSDADPVTAAQFHNRGSER